MSDLGEIIARLERATGPDRELDKAILEAIGWRRDKEACGIAAASEIWVSPDGEYYDAVIDPFKVFPHPTASLDSALMLFPQEWRLEHIGEQLSGGRWDCELHWREYSQELSIVATGATGSLAVCVASLKARQSLGVEGKTNG